MRAVIWLTFILAALYGGYWVVGSRAALRGAEAALVQMKAEGRADYASVSIEGFPSRFDLTIDAPKLVSPDGWSGWSAPFVQLLALSYRPNHLIAVFPDSQSFFAGPDQFTLKGERIRASVALSSDTSLTLDHAEMEGHALDLSASTGWQIMAQKLILASRQSDTSGTSHELALVLSDLAPGADLRSLIDPTGLYPAVAETARADMVASFDRPLDRGLTEAPAKLTALKSIDIALKWGNMALTIKGDLTIDPYGYPSGRLALEATDWRAIYGLLRNGGVIAPEVAANFENGLAEVAKAGGDANVLDLPLSFQDGAVWLGPLALGPAPRF